MRRVVLLSAVALIGPALMSPRAQAEDGRRVHTAQAVSPHDPSQCYCRAQGRMFSLGERTCLRTAEGPRIAECRMVTNVTSWGVTERRCPDS